VRTLVTGANGFLGTALVQRLLACGETSLRLLVRNSTAQANLERIVRERPDADVDFCIGTLCSGEDATRAVDGVEKIFHLAAALRGSPSDMCLNTVVASKTLLEAAAARKPMRIVLVSSFAVYGSGALQPGSLLDENTPLEAHPELREAYCWIKLRQERLFREFQSRYGFELVIVRPGVIYGRGGRPLPGRVGIDLFGVFLHLGGANQIPLTYVDNCADAVIAAGRYGISNEAYNIHDDELVTSREYLNEYKRRVKRIRAIGIPRAALTAISHLTLWYHRRSRGQLPALFTPYKTRAVWTPTRFSNAKIKSLGWTPRISTREGLRRAFTG
jgi:nucleoside-diphosphate-sugar epimerase